MQKYNDAITALQLQSPFFGALVYKLKHISDATLNPPTAATDGKVIRYNPAFIETLLDEETVFLIGHEIMHGVLQHPVMQRDYYATDIGPDGKKFVPKKWAHAVDYVVNAILKEAGIGKLIKGCPIDDKYTHLMTPQEVYCLLPDPSPNESGGNNAGLDEHTDGDPEASSVPGEAGGGITHSDIVQAAGIAKAVRGKMPAGFERVLEDITRPKVNPWSMLRRLVLAATRGHERQSFRRLNRRLVHRGIGAPSSAGCTAGHIGIVVDVSGSIDDVMLKLFGGHMAAIMGEVRPKQVSVAWVDSHVNRTDVVKTPTDLRRLLSGSVPGGGGTQMPAGVEHLVRLGCECVVVLTDMHTPFGSPSPVPVIWASTTAGKTAPHGTTVNISE